MFGEAVKYVVYQRGPNGRRQIPIGVVNGAKRRQEAVDAVVKAKGLASDDGLTAVVYTRVPRLDILKLAKDAGHTVIDLRGEV